VNDDIIEIRPDEFPHRESEIHGRSHIHRVMFWTQKLCTSHGLQEIAPEALCAARLHDLARKHDGECLVHGAAAAALLPDYEELFAKLGATDMEAIEYAVAIHCLPVPLDRDHPHYKVAAVLRDADALDRFRLGPEGPDINRLNLQRSEHFLGWAKKLVDQTFDNETPWATIRDLGASLSNPAQGFSAKVKGTFDPDEPPRKRRNRRLLQGKFAKELQELLDNLETISIIAEAQKVVSGLSQPHGKTELVGMIRAAKEFAAAFIPVTYIKKENLERFLAEGESKSVWELPAPTWHTKFSESAEAALDARAYNDLRLWGEKGIGMTYGALIFPEDERTDSALRHMYGPCRIVWKPEVLESASFCMNDSQESPFCLPHEVFEEAVTRTLLHKIGRHGAGGEALAPILARCENPFPPSAFHFFEAQYHRRMTPNDMVRHD